MSEREDWYSGFQRRFERAGLPVTCLGWIAFFVILVIAKASAAALREAIFGF